MSKYIDLLDGSLCVCYYYILQLCVVFYSRTIYAILTNFPESFKREDIAAALVSTVTQDIAQSCHLTAMAHNVKSIYLCGSVVGTSQYLRTQMNMTLAVRGILNSLVGTQMIGAVI